MIEPLPQSPSATNSNMREMTILADLQAVKQFDDAMRRNGWTGNLFLRKSAPDWSGSAKNVEKSGQSHRQSFVDSSGGTGQLGPPQQFVARFSIESGHHIQLMC
jgi:hypothetical protein